MHLAKASGVTGARPPAARNPLLVGAGMSHPVGMSTPENAKKPLDHLPPQEERDDAEIEEPQYPDASAPGGGSPVSPETAAEPDEPGRHGLARPPQQGA